MDLYIMGDIHGVWGDAEYAYNEFRQRTKIKPDALIQVGDYDYYPSEGLSPLTGKPDPYHYRKSSGLWERNFDHHCIFIDGNHEDHEALREGMKKHHEASSDRYLFTVSNGDGSAKCIWEYAQRGWCRDGILCIGGASSVDKEYRLRWGHHWSELENLTREEVKPILDANHENVKVVISHTCPSSFDMAYAAKPAFGGENKEEINRVFLQQVLQKYKPKRWYFGHWHRSGTGVYVHEDGSETVWQCLGINEITYLDMEGL